jgi:hypothetical protein
MRTIRDLAVLERFIGQPPQTKNSSLNINVSSAPTMHIPANIVIYKKKNRHTSGFSVLP